MFNIKPFICFWIWFQVLIAIQTKACFPIDVVWALGILDDCDISKNVNQVVKIEGNLLLVYLSFSGECRSS